MFFGCVVVLKNHSCAPKHAARTAPQKINFASSKRSAQGANQKLGPRPNTKRFWGGSCLIAVDHGEAAWFLLLGHCFDSCCWLGKGCKKNMARDPKHKKTLDQHPALTHVVRAPCVHIVWGTIPNLVGKKVEIFGFGYSGGLLLGLISHHHSMAAKKRVNKPNIAGKENSCPFWNPMTWQTHNQTLISDGWGWHNSHQVINTKRKSEMAYKTGLPLNSQ